MTNPKKSKELGAKGELLAANYLKAKGFTILQKNYHTRHGEVDIIATIPPTLYFFEVKTRTPQSMNHPAETIPHQKRQKLIRTALTYLDQCQSTPIKSWRMSLISILLQSGPPQIEIIDIY